ncbi:MAG: mevalonate kinase [Promethearchaeota archaeon]
MISDLNSNIRCSAPSRICLFGEHSDYLGLPIIAAAINKRLFLEGNLQNSKDIIIHQKDLKTIMKLSLDEPIIYKNQRDYIRSCIVVFQREVQPLKQGFKVTINSDIPIGKGLSSSSVLCVGWLKFLHLVCQQTIDPLQIASLAHISEVVEFKEPGGIMDHYTSALESFIFLDCLQPPIIEKLNISSSLKSGFIIGDSLQIKDTLSNLTRLKNTFRQGFIYLDKVIDRFNPRTTSHELVMKKLAQSTLSKSVITKTQSIIANRDLTLHAKELLQHPNPDPEEIGTLLTKHHGLLRDDLKCSTPHIEKMIQVAQDAGAYGAKIVGSGSGGCVIVLAPNESERIIHSIRDIGFSAFVVELLG